ncbi:MAG TPA: VWA domain-containing protein, partial [Asanoa sp.]|nr:VWA domain-containing protein [Asanoa sp.]
MVIRRALAAFGVAAIVLTGTPAYADGDLAVSVAEVRPGQVRLVAALPGTADGRIPPVTVSRDGYALPAAVAPGAAKGAPRRTLTVVVGPGVDGDAVATLAGSVPADVALGLVAATNPPLVAVRPTRDRAAFKTGLDGLRTDDGADLSTGLRTAAALAPDTGERRLLLVATAPGGALTDTAATLARAGQRVDVVTVGPAAGLAALASATGGDSRVATAGTLAAALRTAAAMPALFTITVSVPPELSGAAVALRVTAGTGAARSSADVEVRFADAPADTSGGGSGSLVDAVRPGTLGVLFFGVLLLALLLVIFGGG